MGPFGLVLINLGQVKARVEQLEPYGGRHKGGDLAYRSVSRRVEHPFLQRYLASWHAGLLARHIRSFLGTAVHPGGKG